MEKLTYQISAQITPREMAMRKNVITQSMIDTANYHTQLEQATDISEVPPYCFLKFKG